jgi:hypothetical protein
MKKLEIATPIILAGESRSLDRRLSIQVMMKTPGPSDRDGGVTVTVTLTLQVQVESPIIDESPSTATGSGSLRPPGGPAASLALAGSGCSGPSESGY